mgnify:CR=1 FL=1
MKDERDKYLLKNEYKKFIENTPEQYKLFWEVVFNAGLRISEALNISATDILWQENKILITTHKRKNHPIIPVIVPKNIIDSIQEYIWKNPAINGRIWKFSRQYAFKLFKSICKKAGLNPKYSPHALRHAHGVMISDITNGNMIEIKNRLRHSSIKSTEFYVHCSEAKQKELSNKIEEYMK